MDKLEGELSQNQITALFCAANEGCITAHDLIADITPLLTEYLIGAFSADGDSVTMEFYNGQKFKLFVEEII